MRSVSPRSVVLVLLALAAPAAAGTLKVPKDFPTIGAAVAAAQPGDTISVSKGTYVEQVSVTVGDLKLVGKQAVIDAGYAGPCIDIAADGVSVSGFTLVNGSKGLHAIGSGLSVSKCVVRTCAGKGIDILGGSCTISGNTVEDGGSDGIDYTRNLPGDTLIEKNTCTANVGDGLAAIGDGLTVSKNRCEQNIGRGLVVNVQVFGLGDVTAGSPVLVEKNTCDDNNVGQLVFDGSTAVVTISKNECSNNHDRGLIVDSAGPIITGNTCAGNGAEGLHLLVGDAQVEKNVATGNRKGGIVVEASNDIADGGGFGNGANNTLTGNTCKDNGGDGITIFTGFGNALDGNKCTGNGDDGIDLNDASVIGATLAGNTCSDNGHEGLDNSGQATVMTDNVCKHNGYGTGPDIAGAGDLGVGTVATFTGNVFATGGDATPSRLDNFSATSPP